MKIVFASSEISPFAKTGGLADVAGSLPKYISTRFERIAVMPLYKSIRRKSFQLEYMGTVNIPHSGNQICAGVFRSRLPGSDAAVYFIDYGEYFDREGLYGADNPGYEDNDSRFAFFCRGVLEICRFIDYKPHVIHCNDWQTGLIPVYLRTLYSDDPFFRKTKVLFTIHNLAYRGLFNPENAIKSSGLPWSVFSMYGVEFYGSFSFLKAGIYYSHLVNTVSPRYSREIQTEEYGEGMHGLLRSRRDSLTGIINGMDYDVWDPSTDPWIKTKYSIKSIENKMMNSHELRRMCGFKDENGVPLVGMVTRLTAQKGIDLIADAIGGLMKRELKLIVLGTGEEYFHSLLSGIAEKYADRIFLVLKHDEELSHRVYAGSDIFLMPSRYEPCGLSQLIALRYGTIPIVRATGGLADTINGYDQSCPSGNRDANGFVFYKYDSAALLECIDLAIQLYKNKNEWTKLMFNAMSCDFSWDRSAKEYEALYIRLGEMIKQ